jgi:DNA replication initiation complex subunit (GINS family)
VLLEQGTQFYMKMNDILIRLQQSINDFKFSRDLQKNDLLQQIGTAVQSQPAQPAP